jgi:hypothetical protein
MRVRVRDVAFPITTDIDPEGRFDVAVADGLVKRCETCVITALKQPPNHYSELQASHIAWIFSALHFTHVTMRNLLTQRSKSPASVDALALARLQLESLYSICLIVEQPSYADVYVKSQWRDIYVRFLLQREECKGLARFQDYFGRTAAPLLEQFRRMSGVSDEEKATVEHEELDTPLPVGVTPVKIQRFPQPMGVVDKLKESTRRQMLARMYPEYRRLCAFAHGSAQSSMFKSLFYERSTHQSLFTETKRENLFQREVGEPAILYSLLSVVQASCELATLYPSDIELMRTLIESWNVLLRVDLLCPVIWEIRSKALLGVI